MQKAFQFNRLTAMGHSKTSMRFQRFLKQTSHH